jgi:hypothetical protein
MEMISQLSQPEIEQCKLVADNAIATMRLEGLEPSQEAKDILERYVAGEFSSDELFDVIDRLLSKR